MRRPYDELHEPTKVAVSVGQEEPEEAWRIIEVDAGPTKTLTPQELEDLGEWLARQARFIKWNFGSDGRRNSLRNTQRLQAWGDSDDS